MLCDFSSLKEFATVEKILQFSIQGMKKAIPEKEPEINLVIAIYSMS